MGENWRAKHKIQCLWWKLTISTSTLSGLIHAFLLLPCFKWGPTSYSKYRPPVNTHVISFKSHLLEMRLKATAFSIRHWRKHLCICGHGNLEHCWYDKLIPWAYLKLRLSRNTMLAFETKQHKATAFKQHCFWKEFGKRGLFQFYTSFRF